MGRPKGSKNKPKNVTERDLKVGRGKVAKNSKAAVEPNLTPKNAFPIYTGLFEITETRPYRIVSGPSKTFDEIKSARESLNSIREQLTLKGMNPFKIVLLPLGPKNEGLLPE